MNTKSAQRSGGKMYYPGFESKAHRDEFFREVVRITRDSLPKNENGFQDATKLGDNWLKLVYPDLLPGSRFELQFSDRSRTHQAHFGPGKLIVLAYYFDRKDLVSAFLEAILPYQQEIESKYNGEVKIDYWGEENSRNYIMIGVRLAEDEYKTDPKRYAATLAKFIQAVFNPIIFATRSVGLL